MTSMIGMRRGTWREALGHLAGQSEAPSEPEERLDPASLAARIGAAPKSQAAPVSNEGHAPWRKALRRE